MDRMSFIGQTHQSNSIPVDDIIQFFDHTMAAYEVVGGVDDLKVHGYPDTVHSSLRIQVQTTDLSELDSIVEYINNTIHNRKDVYGRSFKIIATKNGSYVDLSVNEDMSY